MDLSDGLVHRNRLGVIVARELKRYAATDRDDWTVARIVDFNEAPRQKGAERTEN